MSNQAKGTKVDKRSLGVHAVGVCLGLLLAGVLYLGVIGPVHTAQKNAIQQRTALSDLSDEVTKMEDSIRRTRDQITVLTSQLEQAVRLQDPSRLNRYVSDITKVATDAKLKVLEAQPGEYLPAHPDYGQVPIVLEGLGLPTDVLAFLRKLQTQCRDVEVAEVSVESNMSEADLPARYRVALDWYTLPTHRVPTTDGRDKSADSSGELGQTGAANDEGDRDRAGRNDR